MKPTNDQPISDKDLLMIYFKEAKQHEIDDCLNNADSCQRLDQLETDMKTIEQAQRSGKREHQLPEEYGQQLWHKIADKLVTEDAKGQPQRSHWLHQIKNLMLVPQYSLASFAVVLVLVSVAFFVGRQHSGTGFDIDLQEQLLAQNIQLHLTQSEIFLTQVSNDNGSYNSQATAQRLLSSNRIFKQALANHEGQFTQQILQDLEPILLEYSNGASAGAENQSHGQQPQASWVSDSKSNDQANNLMFQIKAMKQQLTQKHDII